MHSTLRENVREWGHAITKQECANHAVKCFRSHLENLVKDKPQYKGRNKLTEAQRKRLASAVRCAIIMRSNEVKDNKVDKITAAKALQEDILNAALHCFGSHSKCKPDYCKTVRALQSSTNVNDSQQSDIPFSSSSDLSHSSTDVSMNSSTSSTSTLDDISQASSNLADCNEDVSDDDALDALFLEQQLAWEEATSDVLEEVHLDAGLEPTVPLDQQMICDIQKIAGRLAAKSSQLIGKKIKHTLLYNFNNAMYNALLFTSYCRKLHNKPC